MQQCQPRASVFVVVGGLVDVWNPFHRREKLSLQLPTALRMVVYVRETLLSRAVLFLTPHLQRLDSLLWPHPSEGILDVARLDPGELGHCLDEARPSGLSPLPILIFSTLSEPEWYETDRTGVMTAAVPAAAISSNLPDWIRYKKIRDCGKLALALSISVHTLEGMKEATEGRVSPTFTSAKGTGAIFTVHPKVLSAICAIDFVVTDFRIDGDSGTLRVAWESLSSPDEEPYESIRQFEVENSSTIVRVAGGYRCGGRCEN